MKNEAKKIVIKNKKAYFLYEIHKKYEAGIELQGTEVKSIRQNKISLADSYCKINKKQEIFILNLNIATYDNGGYANHKPLRKRRLLLHKREITRLRTKLQEQGFTLIPLSVYFKRGWAKIELGLGKGKKKFDKREKLKKQQMTKDIKKYY